MSQDSRLGMLNLFMQFKVAAENNDQERMNELLQNAGITTYVHEIYGTVLNLAAQNGHAHVVKTLIDGGANVNTQDEYCKTALYWVAQENYFDVAEVLIERCDDIHITREAVYPFLDWVAKNGRIKLVQTLLERCKDVKDEGQFYNKLLCEVLHLPIDNKGGICKLLIDHGANGDSLDKTEVQALQDLLRSGKKTKVALRSTDEDDATATTVAEDDATAVEATTTTITVSEDTTTETTTPDTSWNVDSTMLFDDSFLENLDNDLTVAEITSVMGDTTLDA